MNYIIILHQGIMEHNVTLKLEFILIVEADDQEEAEQLVDEMEAEDLLSVALENVEQCNIQTELLH
jgi:hypothetical protein